MSDGAGFHILGDDDPVRPETQNRRSPRKRSRKLVLLDLENVMFGRHEENRSEAIRSEEILRLAEARRPGDMIVIGCNPRLAFRAKRVFPRARLVTGHGRDGADNALINCLDLEHAAERFDELCIVSGDHAFADVARAARKAGMRVRVVAPRFGLNGDLRLQADMAITLADDPDELPGDIAA